MGFLAQAGHVGIKTQASKGTYASPAMAGASPAAGDGVYFYTRSGSLGGNRELLIPDPEIGGNRDVPDAQLGPIAFSGEFDFYARLEVLPTLLRAALGTGSTAGPTSTTAYTHTITPNDASLPWMSVEERIADGYNAFKYTDAKVSSFHLEADANGYLMGTVGMVALTQELFGDTDGTPIEDRDYDATPLIVGSNICVTFDGEDLPAKSFNLDIANNIEDDDFRLCSMTLGDLVEKRRETTMGVTIRPEDGILWRTAMWGSPVATQPLGQSYKAPMTVHVTSYEIIPGSAAPPVTYDMLITIPEGVIAPFNVTPSGDDVLEHDLEIRALRPDATEPLLEVTVRNGLSTIR
jgi:hypothetical protein